LNVAVCVVAGFVVVSSFAFLIFKTSLTPMNVVQNLTSKCINVVFLKYTIWVLLFRYIEVFF
jgi:hypothetical protein